MTDNREHKIIPDGELHCIWMDAGVVAYKLCDRRLECDGCPFEAIVRMRNTPEGPAGPVRGEGAGCETGAAGGGNDPVTRAFRGVTEREIPADRQYASNHLWVRRQKNGRSLIGIDHIAANFLPTVLGVVLPQTPLKVGRNAPCSWIVLREGTITLRAPVAGTIELTNTALTDSPALLRSAPYEEGWLLELRPLRETSPRLIDHRKAGRQFRKGIEELRGSFTAGLAASSDQVGVTLHDGGVRLDDIQSMIGPLKYFTLISKLFL